MILAVSGACSINSHPKINVKLEGYGTEEKKKLGLVLGRHACPRRCRLSFLSPIIAGPLPGQAEQGLDLGGEVEERREK